MLYGMKTAPMISFRAKKLDVSEMTTCRWSCGYIIIEKSCDELHQGDNEDKEHQNEVQEDESVVVWTREDKRDQR